MTRMMMMIIIIRWRCSKYSRFNKSTFLKNVIKFNKHSLCFCQTCFSVDTSCRTCVFASTCLSVSDLAFSLQGPVSHTQMAVLVPPVMTSLGLGQMAQRI